MIARKDNWTELSKGETGGTGIWQGRHNSDVYLWVQDKSLLVLDEVQNLVHMQEGVIDSETKFNEVIFLSRHSAGSGVAALTVHPIGIPWLSESQKGRYGGQAGKCSPPSTRLASLYRGILAEATAAGATDRFQVTMEATHHGPYCSIPACFVEIGSSEATWDDEQAGTLWANTLESELHLHEIADTTVPAAESMIAASSDADKEVVMVAIGGGHYVPKANDLARKGIQIGHMLASYAIQPLLEGKSPVPDCPVPEGEVTPTWQSTIMEAVNSTQIAYPNAKIIVWFNKTCCKAEPRQGVIDLLESHGIAWTHSVAEVK